MTPEQIMLGVRGEVEAALQCATDDHTKHHLQGAVAMLDGAQKDVARLYDGRLTATFTLDHVVHAMRAAWIEWKYGNGSEAAMCWIENTLDGPDQIPDVKETGTDAQAYFDREIAASRQRETAARAGR